MDFRAAFRSLLALIAILLASPGVHAQVFRAYLSVTGSDSNPCTLQAPCRLLPAALTAIIDGGEIWMLDSANYNTGPVSVGKSASILAVPGAVGSLVTLGGSAVNINVPGVTVSMRNLVISPFPNGGNASGISLTADSKLVIVGSLIAGIGGNGVTVTAGQFEMADSIIRNIGGYAVAVSGGAKASISGSKFLKNLQGGIRNEASTPGTTSVTLTDSVISGLGDAGEEGVWSFASVSGGLALANVTRCTIEYTGIALLTLGSVGGGLGRITIGGSMIVHNVYAWDSSAGPIRSHQNNQFSDNSNSTGTLTSLTLQ